MGKSRYHWGAWLDYIQAGEVVPVLGPELNVVEEDGKSILLERWVAHRLAEKYGIPPAHTDGVDSLNAVVSTILREGHETEAIVYADVRDLVRDGNLRPPEWLRKLARITDFNLFVTTTFDPLMEMALNEERFGGSQKTVIIRNSLRKMEDLSEGDQDTMSTTLFHLMGHVGSPPYFAVTENDRLEFFCRLLNKLTRPERLFGLLKEKHLLFLGGNFPEWAGRFMLRTVRNDHLSKRSNPTIETIVGEISASDPSLAGFLNHFSKSTTFYPDGDSIAFVDEMYRRWAELRSPEALVAEPRAVTSGLKVRGVFLSYAREDQAAARELRMRLERAGCDVWMDETELRGGDYFARKIHVQIDTCAKFIPIISQHTEARREGWFRKEWSHSIARLSYMHKDVRFILPVTVDDTDARSARWVPDEFKDYQWTFCPGGVPPSDFFAQVSS